MELEAQVEALEAELAEAEIRDTSHLLAAPSTAEAREVLCQSVPVPTTLILSWANQADLMRISGIGPQFSELLRVVGVGGLSDLRVSNAKDLAERMTAANESGGKRISRRVPTEGAVRD